MALQSLQATQKAINDVQELTSRIETLFKQVGAALAVLSAEARKAATDELLTRVPSWMAQVSEISTGDRLFPADVTTIAMPRIDESRLPNLTALIFSLLRHNPTGLTSAQIVEATRGRFASTTPEDNRDRLVYSTLSNLRSKQRLVQLSDGRHTIPPGDQTE